MLQSAHLVQEGIAKREHCGAPILDRFCSAKGPCLSGPGNVSSVSKDPEGWQRDRNYTGLSARWSRILAPMPNLFVRALRPDRVGLQPLSVRRPSAFQCPVPFRSAACAVHLKRMLSLYFQPVRVASSVASHCTTMSRRRHSFIRNTQEKRNTCGICSRSRQMMS